MLENCVSVEERWGGVDRIVKLLLTERQQLLVQYCSACAIEGQGSGRDPRKIKRFCQILVDYVSAGHFEVYEQLLKEADAFNENSSELLKKYYPPIERSTEMAVQFNDRYSESIDYRTVSKDLSALGVALENRFEAEDVLIESLHTSHKDMVA